MKVVVTTDPLCFTLGWPAKGMLHLRCSFLQLAQPFWKLGILACCSSFKLYGEGYLHACVQARHIPLYRPPLPIGRAHI